MTLQNYSHQQRAAGSLVLATMIYGMYGIFTRFVAEDFEVFSQLLVRNTLIFLAITVVIAFLGNETWKRVRREDAGWITLWGLSGIFGFVTYFIALTNQSIALTVVTFYAGMIASSFLIGWYFLGERLTWRKILALKLIAAGLAFVYASKSIEGASLLYITLGTVCGIVSAAWFILSKRFSSYYPLSQITVMDSALRAILCVPLLFIVGEQLPAITASISWFMIVVYAFAQLLTMFLVVYGYRHIEAQVGTLILPLEIFFGAFFGFLIFGEILAFSTIVAGGFIVAGFFVANTPLSVQRRAWKQVRWAYSKGLEYTQVYVVPFAKKAYAMRHLPQKFLQKNRL